MKHTHDRLTSTPFLFAAGDIARQAANAPRNTPPPAAPPAPEPPAPEAEPVNRFDAMFPSYHFKAASSSAGVYGEDRLSQKLATVIINVSGPLGPTGAILQGSIKAVQNKGEEEAHAEFTFMGQLQGGQCFKTDNPQAQRELDSFKSRILTAWQKWDAEGGPRTADVPTAAVKLNMKLKPKAAKA